MKKFLTYALVALAFGGVAAAIYRQSQTAAVPESTVTVNDPTDLVQSVTAGTAAISALPSDVVTVTYFTSDVRCPSCLKIEELTKRSVESGFAKELEDGKIVFRIINIDQPENRHYINDYQLVSKTVIVSETVNGEETDWVNVQEVWSLLRNETEFVNHVRQIVRGFL